MSKYYTLTNGDQIPKVGFGTYKITDKEKIETSLSYAFEAGYSLLDTAYFYDNEEFIGDFLQGIDRDSYQIATKVWPSDFGYDNTLKSVERSLKALKLDYIDIIYLHWPGHDMEESYKALEKFYDEKIIKNLALANFLPKHYEKLSVKANIKPVINQIEVHPLMTNKKNISYFQKENLQIVSWSPLARAKEELLTDKKIKEICKKHSKSPAQVILRWHLEQGLAVIPKSSNRARIFENIDIFDFSLDEDDMRKIDSLNREESTSRRPDDEDWLREMRYGS